jgi:NAD(P)H-hydrate epimerase
VKIVSVKEMQRLDRMAIERLGIPSIVLMENAGRSVAEAVIETISSGDTGKAIFVCGTGNNGGDGFVAARYTAGRLGVDKVTVFIIGDPSRIKGDPLTNLKILKNIGTEIKDFRDMEDMIIRYPAGLLVDAIFGIGLKGEIKGEYLRAIEMINDCTLPVVSADVPSGLDADNGIPLPDAVKAKKTVTMQFPKKGFYINKGPIYTGEVIVADIGIFEEGERPCAA